MTTDNFYMTNVSIQTVIVRHCVILLHTLWMVDQSS